MEAYTGQKKKRTSKEAWLGWGIWPGKKSELEVSDFFLGQEETEGRIRSKEFEMLPAEIVGGGVIEEVGVIEAYRPVAAEWALISSSLVQHQDLVVAEQ